MNKISSHSVIVTSLFLWGLLFVCVQSDDNDKTKQCLAKDTDTYKVKKCPAKDSTNTPVPNTAACFSCNNDSYVPFPLVSDNLGIVQITGTNCTAFSCRKKENVCIGKPNDIKTGIDNSLDFQLACQNTYRTEKCNFKCVKDDNVPAQNFIAYPSDFKDASVGFLYCLGDGSFTIGTCTKQNTKVTVSFSGTIDNGNSFKCNDIIKCAYTCEDKFYPTQIDEDTKIGYFEAVLASSGNSNTWQTLASSGNSNTWPSTKGYCEAACSQKNVKGENITTNLTQKVFLNNKLETAVDFFCKKGYEVLNSTANNGTIKCEKDASGNSKFGDAICENKAIDVGHKSFIIAVSVFVSVYSMLF